MTHDEGEGEDGGIAILRSRWHMIGELEIAGIVADHAMLRRLCDDLELIADALPELPAAAEAELCRVRLEEFVPLHYRREERLFQALFDGGPHQALRRSLFAEIRAAHLLDNVHAQDLAAALSQVTARPVQPETLAYMLRCFFDGCRRAMAFETLAILMLGEGRLTAEAREMLLESLATPRGAA